MTTGQQDRIHGLVGSVAIKAPCRVAASANITLEGEQTIDGVAVVSGDYVLVLGQTDATENGVWVADTGEWSRRADFDGALDVVEGTIVSVLHGTTNSDTYWKLTTTGTVTFGTDDIDFAAALAGSGANVAFLQSGTGAVSRTMQSKERDIVSVLDFIAPALHAQIAAGTYTGDLTTQVQHAVDLGRDVYFPKGTYLFNVVATIPFKGHGEGTEATKVMPYDYTKPIVNYKLTLNTSYQWDYNTTFRDISFEGTAGTQATNAGGVGFSVGAKDPTVYTANDAFIGFVTFENCRFKYLYKGVQCPSGNLGFSFINCNASSCYYGYYIVQGLGFMPNCHFWQAGEIDSCICGAYVSSDSDGFGGISFDNVTFEANSINAYVFLTLTSSTTEPPMFRNCWSEASGTVHAATATIDLWTGNVLTTQVINSYPFVISCDYVTFDGGMVNGIHLLGANNIVLVRGARVEQDVGYGGQAFLVDDATTSFIFFEGCNSISGFGNLQNNCYEVGVNFATSIGEDAANANGRTHSLPVPFAKHSGIANGVDVPFDQVTTLTEGGGTVRTPTATADGTIFPYCCRYQYNSNTGNIFSDFAGTSLVVSAGYYVAMVMVKVTTGAITFYVYDGANKYALARSMPTPLDGQWKTYGGICKISSGATLRLSTLTQYGVGTALDFRVGGYQLKRFETYIEALQFLYSGTYHMNERWTGPGLLNSWANAGGGTEDSGYTKDPAGNVHLRGIISGGTATPGTSMFVLPVGYRPSKPLYFPIASNDAFGVVIVNTNGSVAIQVGSNVYLNLSGITFRVGA